MKDWLVYSQLANTSETHVSCSPTVTWIFQSKTFHYFQSSSSQYLFPIIHTSNKQQVTIPHAFYSMDSQTKRKFRPVSMSGQRLMAGVRWSGVSPAPTSLYVAWVSAHCTVSHRWRNSSYVRNMERCYKPVLCKHRGRHTFWNVNILPSLGLLCYTDGQNNRGHSYSQIYE